MRATGHSKTFFSYFKNLNTDLDKLKLQFNNLKNIKLSSKLLHSISLKKDDLP